MTRTGKIMKRFARLYAMLLVGCAIASLAAAHEGERPMNIVWHLETPLPASLFGEFSILRGA